MAGYLHPYPVFDALQLAQGLSALGNVFGLEADAITAAILATSQSAGNVVAFTPPTSGNQYPNATFSFPAGLAMALQGRSVDGVAFVHDASANIVEVSNVDRVTVQ